MTGTSKPYEDLTVEELRDFVEWLRCQPKPREDASAISFYPEYDRIIHSVPEWIAHNGTACPLGVEVLHRRRYRDGPSRSVTTGRAAGNYHWDWAGTPEGNADILAYQVFVNRRHFHYIVEMEDTGKIKFE